ncbi:CPBP family glutamic-type intramembrane protease [Sorangium sp. So ce260]|uniref:CPBP family glutamic-type intramembrane protease n=1 Tax=Sorangium sp. So ce260 TaxID=3133291 RepID=UPI003F643CE3
MPFTLVHVGKPALEVLLTIPGGLLFGALALRGRSMLGPFLLHWTLAASVDVWVNLGGLRADWRRPAEQYQGDRREDSQIKRRYDVGV